MRKHSEGVLAPLAPPKNRGSTDKEKEEAEIVLEATGWSHLYIPEPRVSKFAITGDESQVVTVVIDPGDSIKGEPGSMMFLTDGMEQAIQCEGFCGRCCSGEACYVVNFTNGSNRQGYAALTPNFPTSKVVPVDMSSSNVNGSLICQQGCFMASYGDVQVSSSVDCNFMRCCCAGTGLVRQKLTGSGTVFLAATGTIVQKVLSPGETMLMDTNCVLAFAESCKLDIRRVGGIVGIIGAGEGIFNTTLTGPGLVLVQSMNEIVFREAMIANKIYRR